MVKRRTVALLGISMLLALGAVWIANNWLNVKDAPRVAEENHVNVVIAAMDIPYGQKFEDQHFELVQLPENGAPENYYSDSEELVGQVTLTDLLEGEVIRQERVASHIEGVTLASLLEPGKRAVSVRVDDVIGVAGFLLPGNHVDVLASRKNTGSKRVTTTTILKKVKVLAVDQTAGTKENDPVVVRAVTLELDPRQVEILVKAKEEGRLQLALRNPMDDVVPQKVAKVKRAKKKYVAPPTTTSVTIIKGVKTETVKVNL